MVLRLQPADADSILVVGAVDDEGDIANFSSRGLHMMVEQSLRFVQEVLGTYCVRSNHWKIFIVLHQGLLFQLP